MGYRGIFDNFCVKSDVTILLTVSYRKMEEQLLPNNLVGLGLPGFPHSMVALSPGGYPSTPTTPDGLKEIDTRAGRIWLFTARVLCRVS